ncbi:hypothetical protein KM043_005894 [Ampulex compressa]|nr:hypothetical protein KM043_005894 [Ampulex compressa]
MKTRFPSALGNRPARAPPTVFSYFSSECPTLLARVPSRPIVTIQRRTRLECHEQCRAAVLLPLLGEGGRNPGGASTWGHHGSQAGVPSKHSMGPGPSYGRGRREFDPTPLDSFALYSHLGFGFGGYVFEDETWVVCGL